MSLAVCAAAVCWLGCAPGAFWAPGNRQIKGVGGLSSGSLHLREGTCAQSVGAWKADSRQRAETAGVPVLLCGVVGQPLGLGGVWAEM